MAEPKHRGRPRLDDQDESTVVTVRMTVGMYDAVYREAQVQRTSVPDVVRRALHYSVSGAGSRSSE